MADFFSKNKILIYLGLSLVVFYFLVALGTSLIFRGASINSLPARLIMIGVSLVYLIYFFCWRYFRRFVWHDGDIRPILFFCFIFIFVMSLAALPPGGDFYHYFFEDTVLTTYHQNPFFVAPNDLPQEPLTHLGHWYFLPTQHGPFRFFLTLPLSFLLKGDIVAGLFIYRIFFALFFLASAVVLYKIIKHLNIPDPLYCLLLFAWNPLIIYVTLMRGGTDILMMFFFLLSFYLLLKEKPYWSVSVLTLSVLIKYVTIIFLPFFIIYFLSRRSGSKDKAICLLKHTGLSLAIVLASFFPFWRGPATLNGIIWVSNFSDFNSFLGSFTILLSFLEIPFNANFLRFIFFAMFLVLYGFLLIRFLFSKSPSPKNLAFYCFLAMAVFLIFGKFWFYSKYLVWLLPLMFLIDKKYYPLAVFLTGAVVVTPIEPRFLVSLFTVSLFVFVFYYLGFYLNKFFRHENLNSNPSL